MSKMQMLTITVTYAKKVHFFRKMKIEMVLSRCTTWILKLIKNY